jgi:hypothetical protein
MVFFTTPKAEQYTQILVRVTSFQLFRSFCSYSPSTHTPIPNDVRGSEPQTLGVRQPISPRAVPGIRILCRIFSASNLTRHDPDVHSTRALRELYLGASARGMLSDLNGPRFSAIISLFGTLSAPDPPCQFKSPLAQHMDTKHPRAWWGFIFQMVRDKKQTTGVLKESDLYWLMRARVSEVSMADLNVYAGDAGEFRFCLAKIRLISM